MHTIGVNITCIDNNSYQQFLAVKKLRLQLRIDVAYGKPKTVSTEYFTGSLRRTFNPLFIDLEYFGFYYST